MAPIFTIAVFIALQRLRLRRTDLEDQSDAFLSRRWKAFLAIGIAPSIALQPSFDYVSNKYKSEEYSFVSDKPPQDVLGVFERLMTTDKDKKMKRNYDVYQPDSSDDTKWIKQALARAVEEYN